MTGWTDSRVVPLACLIALSGGCLAPPEPPVPASDSVWLARIRRTAGGIPHISADDPGSLAFGTIYAMAEDDPCILAEQYLTFGAERSRHLGGEGGNRESDFFHQLLIDRGDAREPLPDELEQVFEGAAAGYNHFLRSAAKTGSPDRRCARAPWLREVTAIDPKRVSRADYALAYMRPLVMAAAPPAEGEPGAGAPGADPLAVARAVDSWLEKPHQGGSNGVAIGRAISRGGRGLLLANPHMPWNEAFQRFYPMHQTIPGRLDVVGANLIGRPRIGFGHTRDVAWTSTVSTARRQSFYRLVLDPEDPTAYLFDGRVLPMRQRLVTIRELTESGELRSVSHTFYETHFGALLVESPFFPWTREHAFAVRLVDVGWRGETSLQEQYAARSVHELKAVHDRYQFLPVNLVAVDRHGEVLYADPGAIPNLPDEVVADCSVLQGAALDGSRSACQWRDDSRAAAPGIFPPAALPTLIRDDFVTNSNDSYWLANPLAPIEGLAGGLGAERTARTLRTRSGLDMLARGIAEHGKLGLEELQALALANESHAGRLIRDDVVDFCRETPRFPLPRHGVVELEEACRVLAEWDLHANLESRGAHLFRQMLAAAHGAQFARTLPAAFVPAVPFDPEDPVATPRGLDAAARDAVLESLARAVVELRAAGIALDAPLGELQHVTRRDRRIPLHGGPEIEGIFNKIEASFRGAEGYPEVDRWSSSWIMAIELGDDPPRSFGILAYSLSSNPDSPHAIDQTEMFSRKQWVALPLVESAIQQSAHRSYTVRAPRSTGASPGSGQHDD